MRTGNIDWRAAKKARLGVSAPCFEASHEGVATAATKKKGARPLALVLLLSRAVFAQ